MFNRGPEKRKCDSKTNGGAIKKRANADKQSKKKRVS